MRPASPLVRPLAFFVLTYTLSWLIWIPLTLSHFGIGPFHISESTSSAVRLLGVLMPAASALLLTGLAGRRAALRGLLGRLLIWRVNWRWWAAAVLVQPVMLVLTGLAYNMLGGQPPILAAPQASIAALLINVFFLLVATLGEEIGWRGLALPALQQRHSARMSSVILGVLWAAWHIPFWLLLDTFDQYGPGYLVLNFLFVLPLTFFITWFYNHGRSSLLLVVAFHVAFNIVNVALFPATTNLAAFGAFIALSWVVALLVMPRLEPPGTAK